MQYNFALSSRPASLSPKVARRCSTVFVNDYTASVEANFAPAAGYSDDECGVVLPRRVPKKNAGTFRSMRASRSKSPQPTRGGAPEEWVPFPNLPRSFVRRVMTPPRARSPLVVPTNEEPRHMLEKKKGDTRSLEKKKLMSTSKNQEKKEKKKGFLSGLSDEKVPHDKRFKNRQLKNDYIKNKFSEMNRMASERTFMTDSSSAGQSNVEENFTETTIACIHEPYFLKEEDEDHFVEGLLMFAPERTIRELTKSEKSLRDA